MTREPSLGNLQTTYDASEERPRTVDEASEGDPQVTAELEPQAPPKP